MASAARASWQYRYCRSSSQTPSSSKPQIFARRRRTVLPSRTGLQSSGICLDIDISYDMIGIDRCCMAAWVFSSWELMFHEEYGAKLILQHLRHDLSWFLTGPRAQEKRYQEKQEKQKTQDLSALVGVSEYLESKVTIAFKPNWRNVISLPFCYCKFNGLTWIYVCFSTI